MLKMTDKETIFFKKLYLSISAFLLIEYVLLVIITFRWSWIIFSFMFTLAIFGILYIVMTILQYENTVLKKNLNENEP